ncbi:MAG TPA: type II secretion system F family protein [Candidatus Paceibacterota bacterium]|nr:type II secretion system F family protein [Candidatus Paceibacterota bacterium]
MKFKVTFRKEDGTSETRVVDAPNRFSVYSDAEKVGEAVTALEEVAGGSFISKINFNFGTGIKTDVLITFTKNMGAMLNAGLTLSRALSVMERQSANKELKKIVVSLEDRVKAGSAFHEALAEHPKVFSKLYIAMSKAGEESGTLAASLGIVARQMERTNALIKKVRGAMIYPGVILSAIVIIGILMMVYIVPTLASTFISLGVKLPFSTQIILGISNFMVAHFILVIIGLIVFVTLVVFALRSKTGAAIAVKGALYAPVVGELMKETYAARAARTLSSLLSSGVEMLTALSISGEVVGNPTFSVVIKEAEERVRKGDPLSAAFIEHPKLYPILFSDMIAVGEETGKVADMLTQVAEYYEADVEDRTKDLSTIIEPVLMLIIGLAVGVFAVAMIGPIYSLTSQIG